MKKFLILALSLLISCLGYSQVTGYSYTIKLGPAKNQVSVYAKPVGSGAVKWQQIEVVVGFQTAAGVPTGTWSTDPSLNSMFGRSYGAVIDNSSTSISPAGYSYHAYSLNLGAGSNNANVTDGTEYLLGTITYSLAEGSPFTPYLLDFADGGNSGDGNTYIVEGSTGDYFTPTMGNAGFYGVANGGYKNSGSELVNLGAGNSAARSTVPPLPLKLLSFTATAQAGKTNTALLSWTVAEQVNTSSFEVERSKDGKSYSKIGVVAAAGNYAGKQTYSFTDASAANGPNYYRLKMVDIDGKFTYSPVKTILFDGSAAAEQLYVSPNPTRGEFHVQGLTATSVVRVLDINGKVLQTYNGVTAYTTLNIAQLPSAVYLVQVIDKGKFVGTFKLVKE